MQSTHSLSTLPALLWPVVVAPEKVISLGQTELFDYEIEGKQMTYAKLNCLK